MKTVIDPYYETGPKNYRSCQAIRSIKVMVENASNNQLIVDRGIDTYFETNIPTTSDICNTNSGAVCNPVVGYAYFRQTFGKFTAPMDVIFTAKATDNSGKSPQYVLTEPGTATVHVEPNQLKLKPHTSTNLYVWSTETKLDNAKSCEDITFGACVEDADNKKPTLPVTITFQFQDDGIKEEVACTAPANDGCCTKPYKAPATDTEKQYTVKITATEPTCYMDAIPSLVGLKVVPVKLKITGLTAAPNPQDVNKEVTASCTVQDSIDSKPVSGAKVYFNLTQKSPGTAVFKGEGSSDANGKAEAKITPTTAGSYNVWAAATVDVVAPNKISCYVPSDRATTFTAIEIKSTCADVCKSTSSKGCAASAGDCAGTLSSEAGECTTGKCCCAK
jgi:hypothetical protein